MELTLAVSQLFVDFLSVCFSLLIWYFLVKLCIIQLRVIFTDEIFNMYNYYCK